MKQLYEVRTYRPIRRPGLPFINKPTRLRLEMDEVKQYMEYGPVYRIFENTMRDPVRVTGKNLEELHGKEETVVENISNETVKEVVEESSKNSQEEESSITDNSSSENVVTSTSISNTNSVFQNTKQWNNGNRGKNNSYNQHKNNHKN